jgi:hypothetical protein
MIKIRYALFTFMLSLLNIADTWAISSTPMILQQQSIYGDTLVVYHFWQ